MADKTLARYVPWKLHTEQISDKSWEEYTGLDDRHRRRDACVPKDMRGRQGVDIRRISTNERTCSREPGYEVVIYQQDIRGDYP